MSSTVEFLGPYRLLTTLAAGKTTLLYEAVEHLDNRRVVVKTLRPEHVQDRTEAKLLRHEYDVVGELKHPRLIEMYEFGVHRDIPFLAMELFRHPSMKTAIREGVDRVAWIAPQIIQHAAEGLAVLNEQGWVHRDVKPDNFLVGPEGDVKLIDFALAQKRPSLLTKLLSVKGKIQGTRSYMSPEQIQAKPVDQRADIYSFGCTVFELIAGKPPFVGRSSDELLTKHLKSPAPSLSAHNPNVTSEFANLVRQMLAKDAGQRPDSMMQVLSQLRSIEVFQVQPARPQPTEQGRDEAQGK